MARRPAKNANISDFVASTPYQADTMIGEGARVIDSAPKGSFGPPVHVGNRAVKVNKNGNRHSADVIVATEFRRYCSRYSPLKIRLRNCFLPERQPNLQLS